MPGTKGWGGMGQQVGPCAQSCPILQAAFTLIQFSFSSLTAHLLGCGEGWSPVSLLMLSAYILSPALAPSHAPELCRRLLDGRGHPYHGIKLLPSPACHGTSPCGRSLLISNPMRGAEGCSRTRWEEVRELLGLRCFPGAHFASGVAQLCSPCTLPMSLTHVLGKGLYHLALSPTTASLSSRHEPSLCPGCLRNHQISALFIPFLISFREKS